MVRPLAYYPLIFLALVLFIRILTRQIKFKLNISIFILLMFIMIAIATSVFGSVLDPIPMHGQFYWGRNLRAWATLIGGLVFFFATYLMNQNEEDLKFTVKFLVVGILVSVVWGLIQASMYFLDFPPKPFLNKIQLSFSIRKLLVKQRVTGFAYEPSWLANQIATVYLPWMLGIVLSGFQVFKQRWLSYIGSLAAAGLLLITFSRGGILIALVSVVLVLLLTRVEWLKKGLKWLIQPSLRGLSSLDRLRRLGMRLGLVIVFLALLGGIGVALSQNKYFAQIWRSNKKNLIEYAVDIYVGPRLAYAEAAWHIFEAHPWTGVGMGASGLYLYDYVPEWSITTLSEITRQLTPEGSLYPNPKNLFLRVLAETGWIGFGIYIVFSLSILIQLLRISTNGSSLNSVIKTAGLITWIAIFFFNFTQDSWIDPNAWFGFALVCGMLSTVDSKNSMKKL